MLKEYAYMTRIRYAAPVSGEAFSLSECAY